jgi:hypothetical protein
MQLWLRGRLIALGGSDYFRDIAGRGIVAIGGHTIPHGDPILDVHANKNLFYKYKC